MSKSAHGMLSLSLSLSLRADACERVRERAGGRVRSAHGFARGQRLRAPACRWSPCACPRRAARFACLCVLGVPVPPARACACLCPQMRGGFGGVVPVAPAPREQHRVVWSQAAGATLAAGRQQERHRHHVSGRLRGGGRLFSSVGPGIGPAKRLHRSGTRAALRRSDAATPSADTLGSPAQGRIRSSASSWARVGTGSISTASRTTRKFISMPRPAKRPLRGRSDLSPAWLALPGWPCLAGPAWLALPGWPCLAGTACRLALPAGWHCLLAGTAWLAFGSLRFERAFGLLSSRDSSWTELTADDYCRCWAGRKSRGRTGAGMNMPCRLCVG